MSKLIITIDIDPEDEVLRHLPMSTASVVLKELAEKIRWYSTDDFEHARPLFDPDGKPLAQVEYVEEAA